MKNWAEHFSEPQMTGSKPAICLRVTKPSCPHDGHDRTAQYGSSFSPTSPAFSSTKMVPGSICSGIHSLRTLSSPIMCPPQDLRSPTTSYIKMTNGTVALLLDCAQGTLCSAHLGAGMSPSANQILAV